MELLESDLDYKFLPDAYVIFICDYDPFGAKKYRYTWEMLCREDPSLHLEDGSHTIILSTRGENEHEVPKELAAFLKYVRADLEESTADYDSPLVRHIQKVVNRIKTSREMEAKYMLWEEMIKEEREAAFQEGRDEERIKMLFLISDLKGELSEPVRECIQSETDAERLREYFRLAQEAESMEAFEAEMNKLL